MLYIDKNQAKDTSFGGRNNQQQGGNNNIFDNNTNKNCSGIGTFFWNFGIFFGTNQILGKFAKKFDF